MAAQQSNRNDISWQLLLIGVVLGLLAWILDFNLDALSDKPSGFLQELRTPFSMTFLSRLWLPAAFILFSAYGARLLARTMRSGKRFRASEEQYRNLVEGAWDITYSIANDGTISSISPSCQSATDWTPEELSGKPFLSIIHPDDAQQATEMFQTVLNGKQRDRSTTELRVRTRSGEYRIGEFRSTQARLDGKVIGIFGAVRDITEHRRMEQELKKSETKYRDLFENANDLIQSVDMDGRFLYVNRAWLKTMGYTREEVDRLTLAKIIHPDYGMHCAAAFEKVRAGEDIGRIEAGFVAKDGHTVIVEGSVSSQLQQGKPVALRCIFSNITGRRLAEEFNKNILESVDEGFIVVTPDYRITLANKAFCAAVKLTAPEVVGKRCYEVSHHTNRPCFEEGESCAVLDVFRTGEAHTAVHMHFDSKGNPVYMEIKAYPIKDSLGKVISAIEVHNDVSERKRLEEQLRHSQKMEAIGTLAGGVAHDFNNILTAIIGYGSLIQMKIDPASPLRSSVDQILASTERAANLTQRLLTFSRKQNAVLKPVDLNVVVGRVDSLLGRLIGEDIEIKLHLHPAGLTVQVDAGQIEQVLMNLVTNARDAMPRGGVLSLATEAIAIDESFIRAHGYGKVGPYVLLKVSDTGQGMDRETQKRIFDPFFTTKEVGKGTGLGLAIVYGIIKQHNGFINVYSEPKVGTTFKLYFPLLGAAVEEPAGKIYHEPRNGSAVILVAEDDADVRQLTRTVLENFGYTVIEAVDGEDAVRQFTGHQDVVQLLLLDVIMPRMNGKEACEEIRLLKPDVKVIFTSGYPAEVIRQKGVLDESDLFLFKPASPRETLRMVQDALYPNPS
jgi:PAS domain S-box-containing protein